MSWKGEVPNRYVFPPLADTGVIQVGNPSGAVRVAVNTPAMNQQWGFKKEEFTQPRLPSVVVISQ
jgi:hypothetical protein